MKFINFANAASFVRDLLPLLDNGKCEVFDSEDRKIPWLGLNVEAGRDPAWSRLGIIDDNEVVVVSYPENSIRDNRRPAILSFEKVVGPMPLHSTITDTPRTP